jgi:carbon storage regulator CsrA
MESKMSDLKRLVLSRKKDQRIRIGNVWVTPIAVRGDKVRLLIEAEPEIKVLREECLPPEEQYDCSVLGKEPQPESEESEPAPLASVMASRKTA